MSSKLSKIKWALISAAALTLIGTVTVAAENKLDGNFPVAGQYVLGDANCDGAVTIGDVTQIQRYIAEMPLDGSFSEPAANVDADEDVDVHDALLIQYWLACFDTTYPIGTQFDLPEETTTAATTEAPTQMPTDEDGWGREIFRP